MFLIDILNYLKQLIINDYAGIICYSFVHCSFWRYAFQEIIYKIEIAIIRYF